MKKAIEVLWKSGNAKGYVDVFPVEQFTHEVTGMLLQHIVRGPKGGVHYAQCSLSVGVRDAEMDYTAFELFNARRGMDRGVMRLEFADAARARVASVWWDGQKLPRTVVSATLVDFKGPVTPGEIATAVQRRMALVQLRPGQTKFRQILDGMYGSRCCVTGCDVPWVLDAAHIRPYAGSASNTGSNGLLLRRDLHALFDAHQLAIHPDSRLVVVGVGPREWPEYEGLHERAVLAPPQPGCEAAAPDVDALRERWARFLKAQDPS